MPAYRGQALHDAGFWGGRLPVPDGRERPRTPSLREWVASGRTWVALLGTCVLSCWEGDASFCINNTCSMMKVLWPNPSLIVICELSNLLEVGIDAVGTKNKDLILKCSRVIQTASMAA